MSPMNETPGNVESTDAAQDWLIISIFFWVLFVLIVSIGYLERSQRTHRPCFTPSPFIRNPKLESRTGGDIPMLRAYSAFRISCKRVRASSRVMISPDHCSSRICRNIFFKWGTGGKPQSDQIVTGDQGRGILLGDQDFLLNLQGLLP